MNKMNKLKKTAALMMSIALTAGATGCNFILKDSGANLSQTVATVDISSTLKEDETYKAYADDVKAIFGSEAKISKSDLVSYYLSVGYQYVESYGYTMEDTLEMLLDGLVSREIIMQYAVAYYLANDNGMSKSDYDAYVAQEMGDLKESTDERAQKEYKLLEAHPDVLTFKYFLTEGGEGSTEDYDSAVYSLKKSLNSSLDSLETTFIKTSEEDSTTDSTEEARTTPTNVGTEKEDYYTTDYDVYTGRNTLDSCGEYEKQEGSTASTRKHAYNSLLSNLHGYNLISKGEDTSDITLLDYYYVELSSSLGQALINKYFEDLEAEVEAKMDGEYVAGKYESILEEQKLAYENDPTSFATAIDGVSDTSFVLYGLKNFGHVYNILIPFSTSQEVQYTQYKNQGLTTNELYNKRKTILAKITGTDLRESWLATDDAENYSYEKDGKTYFFEDNLTNNDKYEKLTQYAGTYAYNVDSKGDLVKLDIDGVLSEMLTHIENVSGATYTETAGAKAAYIKNTQYVDKNGDVDYSKFIYTSGKVNLGNVSSADFFNEETTAYKALSAVNEIMFAYSTDTGCLNTYMGYSVSPFTTNFVKEFEYAAQWAVKNGVGSYAVCATDYGWHIIYCSFKYEGCEICAAGGDCGNKLCGGEVYGGYDHNLATGPNKVEGSFSNLFYESLKDSMVSNATNEIQSMVLNQYDNETSVKRYKKVYEDLLDS